MQILRLYSCIFTVALNGQMDLMLPSSYTLIYILK